MKKLFVFLTVAGLIFSFSALAVAGTPVTKKMVVKLVEKVSQEITKDAPGTFAKIIKAEHPYKNKDNPALYVFVYDTDVKIVAHPKKVLVGKSYKGKPDVKGKKFRDDIVKTGIKSGTGWVDYSYQKPGEKGIHAKTTYLKLVKGSDGNKYVVCAGMYK